MVTYFFFSFVVEHTRATLHNLPLLHWQFVWLYCFLEGAWHFSMVVFHKLKRWNKINQYEFVFLIFDNLMMSYCCYIWLSSVKNTVLTFIVGRFAYCAFHIFYCHLLGPRETFFWTLKLWKRNFKGIVIRRTMHLINIWQMFNVAKDTITAKSYILQKFLFQWICCKCLTW